MPCQASHWDGGLSYGAPFTLDATSRRGRKKNSKENATQLYCQHTFARLLAHYTLNSYLNYTLQYFVPIAKSINTLMDCIRTWRTPNSNSTCELAKKGLIRFSSHSFTSFTPFSQTNNPLNHSTYSGKGLPFSNFSQYTSRNRNSSSCSSHSTTMHNLNLYFSYFLNNTFRSIVHVQLFRFGLEPVCQIKDIL